MKQLCKAGLLMFFATCFYACSPPRPLSALSRSVVSVPESLSHLQHLVCIGVAGKNGGKVASGQPYRWSAVLFTDKLATLLLFE